jgi:short-subunit dehydrogenase
MARRSIAGLRTIVTGASMGIGRALAEELAGQGARVVLGARSIDDLELLAATLRRQGTEAWAVRCDVTVAADRQALLDAATQHFGGLDLLVNNAGVGALGPFATAGEERLRRVMEVNFFAAVELIRLCLPALRAGSRPMIVNVSSVIGRRGVPRSSEYCASKFALAGFSEALRAEVAKDGIDVLVACPGVTTTEFFDHLVERQGDRPWPKHPTMSPATVARKTVRAIRRGKHEVVLSAGGKLILAVNRFVPRLLDRFLARY